MRFYKHFFMMTVALVIATCVGFTSCKDDDDDEDSKRPLTGYWVSEGEHEDFFYYIHPNGCGFCGDLRDNPPEIYDVFESYVITNDKELVIYWLDPDFSTDPDNKGKVTYDRNTFRFEDYNHTYVKKGNDYPYALNFQGEEYYGYTAAELLNWWNSHTK